MRSYDSLPATLFRCKIVQKWYSRNPLLNSTAGMLWKFGEGRSAQVSSWSSNCGSKLR
ncbi:hypothetical protein AVEN_36618-1, partial [Araneus ventricosus]